ncbi:hypothetical protein FHX40_4522 [Thermopolyspora flexuosa]|uniref:Uncharacterized protein n=1 Tax=Thermopolyspora flexuosa TaxID=103836 RepID=A0A543J4K5_9ACTN|nr:hypothetical protein FHX40_4522 [Thermopolyspora flexuosa]
MGRRGNPSRTHDAHGTPPPWASSPCFRGLRRTAGPPQASSRRNHTVFCVPSDSLATPHPFDNSPTRNSPRPFSANGSSLGLPGGPVLARCFTWPVRPCVGDPAGQRVAVAVEGERDRDGPLAVDERIGHELAQHEDHILKVLPAHAPRDQRRLGLFPGLPHVPGLGLPGPARVQQPVRIAALRRLIPARVRHGRPTPTPGPQPEARRAPPTEITVDPYRHPRRRTVPSTSTMTRTPLHVQGGSRTTGAAVRLPLAHRWPLFPTIEGVASDIMETLCNRMQRNP